MSAFTNAIKDGSDQPPGSPSVEADERGRQAFAAAERAHRAPLAAPAAERSPSAFTDALRDPTQVAPTDTHGSAELPRRVQLGLQARDVLPVLMTAAGVLAIVSGQQPTGNIGADFVLSFVFGAGLVWLSRYAETQPLLISATLALFFTGLQFPVVLVGAGALGVALFLNTGGRFDRDSWTIGAALAAALISQTVLRLPNIRFVGSASVLALIAIAPLVWSALRALPDPVRRRCIRAGAALCAFAGVASVLAVGTALSARGTVEEGIELARSGVTAVESGDQALAVQLLEAAEARFEQANSRLGGPLTWPARFVPVVAQHARALETASDQGSALARTASRVVTRADVEQIRGANGRIDLELVADVHVELTAANIALDAAQQAILDVRTAWLLPLLDSRLSEVQVELNATAQDIDLATEATAVLPAMLGADGMRTYLVLFIQPAEAREYGGLVGAYGLLQADQGRFQLVESGSMFPDFGVGAAAFTSPGDFPSSYVATGPDENPQNLASLPDLTTIARAAKDLAPQWRSNPDFDIDGVMTVDPYALAGFLTLTGPIQIEGRAEPLDATNVVDFLLRDQYLEFDPADRSDRQDLLRVLAGEAFGRLLTIDVPGPERLGAVFGPIARANRLGFVTFDDRENAFLDRVLLSADLPRVGPDIDLLGVYTATATASKLDAYTKRSTTYIVDVDPATGEVVGRATVRITNDAPAGLPAYVLGQAEVPNLSGGVIPLGTNLVALSVYDHGEAAEVAGDQPFRVVDVSPALGYTRTWIVLEVPRATTATMTFETRSMVTPGRYDLVVPASQSAIAGDFTLIIRPAAGWRVVAGDAAVNGSWQGTVSTETGNAFRFEFAREG